MWHIRGYSPGILFGDFSAYPPNLTKAFLASPLLVSITPHHDTATVTWWVTGLSTYNDRINDMLWYKHNAVYAIIWLISGLGARMRLKIVDWSPNESRRRESRSRDVNNSPRVYVCCHSTCRVDGVLRHLVKTLVPLSLSTLRRSTVEGRGGLTAFSRVASVKRAWSASRTRGQI